MFYLFTQKKIEKKPVRGFLKKIFGINFFLSEIYCKKLGFSPAFFTSHFSSKQRALLEHQIAQDQKNLKEEKLLRALLEKKKNLAQTHCFKGLKHKKGFLLQKSYHTIIKSFFYK
jgi:ribosomal protein S13